MSETIEKPEAFSTSLYVTDRKAFEECKRLLKLQGKSLSEEIMDFVLKRLAELKGSTSSTRDSSIDHEALSRKHVALSQEKAKLEKLLKDSGSYDRFMDVIREILARRYNENVDKYEKMKLEAHLSGGPETAKFQETVRLVLEAGKKKGDTEGATNFVRLMQLIRQQKTIQEELNMDILKPEPEEPKQKEEAKPQEMEEEPEDDLKEDAEEDA